MQVKMAPVERGWLIGLAISCSALVPSVCSAVPPTEDPTVEPRSTNAPPTLRPRRWYGWQTFAADGAASALFLAAVADDHSTTLFALSGLTFGLGAPVIHVTHGNWEVGLASLGLRFSGVFVGVMIGSQSDIRVSEDATSSDSSSKWALTGAAIGSLVASAIDGLLLSYDTRVAPVTPHRNQLLRAESLPQVMMLKHGVALGYSGQF